MDIILKELWVVLIAHFPQIAGYVAMVLITGILVWKTASFYNRTNIAVSEVSGLKDLMTKVSSGLSTLNAILLEAEVITQSCYSSQNSPRIVNPLGEKLLNESGAYIVYNKIKDDLIKSLESKNFNSLLDLERGSTELMIGYLKSPEFKDVQNFVFEHPVFEGRSLRYTDILFLLALKLRDEFRRKHPKLDEEAGE